MWWNRKGRPDGLDQDGDDTAPDPLRSKERLSVVPLAVLLPKLGELTDLPKLASGIERKYEELVAATESDPEQNTQLASEQAMLNQVVQWLSIGTRNNQ